ncbi:MAG: phosphoribosylformylglycinamidine cyclo-ligase [Gammaproteobacteria bacterium]|nr:phosphoribosylformylglycinamidine cyclo-ligase [Gammaproteobacteria bacterium]
MPQKESSASAYRKAGVDIDAGNRLVKRLAPLARQTFDEQVLADLGGFGGLYQLPQDCAQPVLVCGTDGVGTKLRLAQRLQRHETIGIDLVAMCANDILTHGARALLFLDYYACGTLSVEEAEEVVRGIAAGCQQAGCVLLGGETAEMPGLYQPGDYDLAGFCVGLVDRDRLLPRSDLQAGDVLIGMNSSGVHANGFSLVNSLLDAAPEDPTHMDALLQPTTIYEPHLREAIDSGKVLALAHITGGGLTENVPRILPEGLSAQIDLESWERPELFDWIQSQGNVEEEEMRCVYNCGIGMVALTRAEDAEALVLGIRSTGLDTRIIGEVVASEGPPKTIYTNSP